MPSSDAAGTEDTTRETRGEFVAIEVLADDNQLRPPTFVIIPEALCRQHAHALEHDPLLEVPGIENALCAIEVVTTCPGDIVHPQRESVDVDRAIFLKHEGSHRGVVLVVRARLSIMSEIPMPIQNSQMPRYNGFLAFSSQHLWL
jgi:hypothetical protein